MDDAGITPFGTVPAAMVTDSDDDLKLHLEGAAAIGAGRVRIGPVRYPQGPFHYAALLGQSIERYQRIVEMARPLRQKIVIETHCHSLAASPA